MRCHRQRRMPNITVAERGYKQLGSAMLSSSTLASTRSGVANLLYNSRKSGCVAKNHLGHKNTERRFSSSGNIEEIGHESNLSANVAFRDSFNLSLPDHVHDLITADGPSRRVETEKAKSGIDSAFYESVILLDDIIEIFALA
jgi:hypothetical protein